MSFDAADFSARAEALLASDRLTTPTRKALRGRLDWRAGPARALSEAQRETLRAVARRLVPAPGLDDALDLGGRFEAQLADGPGDGWRYATMPSDVETQRLAMEALGAAGFTRLDTADQDAMLTAIQRGEVEGWAVDPARWFEETLAALTEIAFAHPFLQIAIGYDGMADARGWQMASPRD